MNLFIGQGSEFLDDHLQLNSQKDLADFDLINSDLHFFKRYYLHETHALFLILYKDKEIVAIMKTQKSMNSSDDFPFQGINFVSVKPKYQGQGFASQLYEELFKKYTNGYVLGTDYDNNQAQKKLEKMSYRMAKQHSVYFMSRDLYNQLYQNMPSKEELYKRKEYT